MSSNLPVPMGTAKFPDRGGSQSFVWDPCETISPHAVIVGSSGTGKTYRLRYIIKELIERSRGVKIHILDVHGDIGPNARNRVVFSETSAYGLNPLEIECDPEYGGVRRRINSFIATLNRSTHKLGARQEAVMRALLTDLYELNGYDAKDPRTWNPKTNPHARGKTAATRQHPGISDLLNLTMWRTKNLATGMGSDGIKALNELNKSLKKFNRVRSKAEDASDPNFIAAKEQVKATAIGYIDAIETGRELDEFLNYDNIDTLRAIYERIKALDSAGIFRDMPPVFRSDDPLRVYDIKALSEVEQMMFAETLLERLFVEVKARGPVPYPDTFVVIDEAHKFMVPDNDHILNRLAREVRKYGVGLILVSQSFNHFSDDLIANSGMTCILGIHDMYHAATSKKLGLKPEALKFIVPQKTALLQIRRKVSDRNLTNAFHPIILPR